MLVVSNGAFKSGSTWLFNILRDMTNFPPPPEAYLNPDWINPSIHPDKLADFLDQIDLSTENYLAKNHFKTEAQRELLLSHQNVVVLDIQRDLRDVVVSSYYHFCRVEGYNANFGTFYWQKGRHIAHEVRKYHRLWNIVSPRIYVSSYERLTSDFDSEVELIGRFLGINLSERDIWTIKNETSLNKLRQRYGEQNEKQQFFRKGAVGDWHNHFSRLMLTDIAKIERQGLENFRIIDKVIAKLSRNLEAAGGRYSLIRKEMLPE